MGGAFSEHAMEGGAPMAEPLREEEEDQRRGSSSASGLASTSICAGGGYAYGDQVLAPWPRHLGGEVGATH